MKDPRSFLIGGIALAVAAATTGCNNTNKTAPVPSASSQTQAVATQSVKGQNDQLAALDSAYQSGVFTKEEYDAKKAVILGTTSAPVPAPLPEPLPEVAQPLPVPAPVPAPEEHPTSAGPPSQAAPQSPQTRQQAPASAAVPRPKPAPAAPAAKTTPSTQAESEPAPAPSRGCEDAEYRTRKDEGPQSRFFPMPVARVKKAALAALDTLDFNIHKQDGNQIEASKKRHLGVVVGAGGEREILQFEAATQGGQRGTRVTGETKKSVVGRLAQKSWTAAVLAQTACNLR